MIQQQYYTRERSGLFNATESYDTVAKSPQLKLEYIRKYLHPLCYYEIEKGQGEELEYPPNMIIVPMASGEMIVGQGVYKATDFTGLRPTFFIHNLVLSAGERRRYIKEPEKLFGITSFATHFDWTKGRKLPTLAAIPYEKPPLFQDRKSFFEKIGMSQGLFNQLIGAAFKAAYLKESIFIILDIPNAYLGEYAKALLYYLYSAIPWEVAEHLGVATYVRSLERKKNIQVMFVDKQIWAAHKGEVEGIVLDLIHKKCIGYEEDLEKEAYIRIGLYDITNKVSWEKYNYLVTELMGVTSEIHKRHIGFYGRIALFFKMMLTMNHNTCYQRIEARDRKHLIKELYGYCQHKLSQETCHELIQLIEYSISLFHQDICKGILWSQEEVIVFLDYKLKFYKENRQHFLHSQQIILCLITQGIKEKKYIYVEMILKMARSYLRFYQELVYAMYQQPLLKEKILYRQIDRSLRPVKSIEELINVMKDWERVEDILLSDGYYKNKIEIVFEEVIAGTEDKVKVLKIVQEWCKRHESEIYIKLRELAESWFLSTVDLEKEDWNEQELCSLEFNQEYPQESYEIIKEYQLLKTDISQMSPKKIHLNSKVQRLIRRSYRQMPCKEAFYLLVYAFLGYKVDHSIELQLGQVLTYLQEVGEQWLFDFIVWSKGQRIYINKEAFDSEVIAFFLKLKASNKKIAERKIKVALGKHERTKVLAGKIIKAQRLETLLFFKNNKIFKLKH